MVRCGKVAGSPHDTSLTLPEQRLCEAIFVGEPDVLLSERRPHLAEGMKKVVDALYGEVVEQGWYPRSPRVRVFPRLRRVPRTAEGAAVRVQTLGFQKYLATAEANQIRFEESLDVFSRYLPYALVFGLAERWAKVVGDVVRQGQLADAGSVALDVGSVAASVAMDPALWMAIDALGALSSIDVGAIGDLADLGGLLDLGELAEGVGSVFEGLGDLIGGIADLFGD